MIRSRLKFIQLAIKIFLSNGDDFKAIRG